MGLFQSTFECAAIEYCRAYESDNEAARAAAVVLLEKISHEYDVNDFALFLKYINDTSLSQQYTVYTVIERLKNDKVFLEAFAKALHIDKVALARMASSLVRDRKRPLKK